MTSEEKESLLADANAQLLVAGLVACREYAEELFAEGATCDEVNQALRRYKDEQLEPWRVKHYREIRRLIDEPGAPSLELQ